MNRFPRAGDYLKFEKDFTFNLGDRGSGNEYLEIPKGTILQIQEIHIYNPQGNGFVDMVPYGFIVSITDPKIYPKPILVRFHYEIHNNFTTVIPGGKDTTVAVLFEKSDDN